MKNYLKPVMVAKPISNGNYEFLILSTPEELINKHELSYSSCLISGYVEDAVDYLEHSIAIRMIEINRKYAT